MASETQKDTIEATGGSVDVGTPAVPIVNWDDSQMESSYANVVNAASTREEVTLFFGTNQTWNPVGAKEFNVRLSNRIVLSPFAAKRLWTLLTAILKQYEERFGALPINPLEADGQPTPAPKKSQASTGASKAS